MHTEVDTSAFSEYIAQLSLQRDKLIERLESLKTLTTKLAWNDDFFENVRGALNAHIDELNRVFSSLDNCVKAMRYMQKYQEEYLQLATISIP